MLDRTIQLCREILEVLGSAGQKKRRTTGLNGTDEVSGNHLVASCVTDKRGVDIVNRDVSGFRCCSKLGMTGNHLMFERGGVGHRASAHTEPGRAALHVD